MGKKGLYCLQNLSSENLIKISFVVCARDRTLLNDYFIDIELFCRKNNINFFSKDDWSESANNNINLAVSWRWLLPEKNTYVIHDSLLPKYRGFAPLISALCAGDEYIGVTLITANKDYDTGDIVYQESIKVEYPIKINEAIDILLPLYSNALNYIFNNKIANLPLCTQNELDASYSLWRNASDYRIDWNKSSEYIKRFIDAVGSPYNGAITLTENNELVNIIDAEIVKDVNIINRDCGKLIFMSEGFPVIVCGSGLLKLTNFNYVDINKNQHIDRFTNFRIKLL